MNISPITPRERFAKFKSLSVPDSAAERGQFFINYWAHCLNTLRHTLRQRGLTPSEYLGYEVPEHVVQQIYNGPDTSFIAWCLPQLESWDEITWEIFLGFCFDSEDVNLVSPAAMQLFGKQTYIVRGHAVECVNFDPEGLQKSSKLLQLTLSDYAIEQPWRVKLLDIEEEWAKRAKQLKREKAVDAGFESAGITTSNLAHYGLIDLGLSKGEILRRVINDVDKAAARAAYKAAKATHVEKLRYAQEQWHNAVQQRQQLSLNSKATNKRVNAVAITESMFIGHEFEAEAAPLLEELERAREWVDQVSAKLRELLGQHPVATERDLELATLHVAECKLALDAVKAERAPALRDFTV